MDNNTFMGLLIGALIVLFGFVSVLVALIFRPILNLNKCISDLTKDIKFLNDSLGNIEERITKHGTELDTINRDIRTFEGRISRIEGRKQ